MKKKLLSILLCCSLALTTGCMPAANPGSDAGKSDSEGQAEEPEAGSESIPVEIIETDNDDNDGQSDLALVETKGAYEKAAYFLDMVYQKNGTGNTIVSPLSLDMALGLVSNGAEGKTKDELNSYLEKDDYGKFASEYMDYAEELSRDFANDFEGGYRTLFEIANSVWVNDNRELIDEYAEKSKKDFKAEIASVSFSPENKSKTAALLTLTEKKTNRICLQTRCRLILKMTKQPHFLSHI